MALVKSGNGDGTFIDKDSIKAFNGPNGTKQIALTQYVLMPAGDVIQEKRRFCIPLIQSSPLLI